MSALDARVSFVGVVLGVLLGGLPVAAAEPGAGTADGWRRVRQLMDADPAIRRSAAKALRAVPDPALAAGIVDALFFTPTRFRGEAVGVLEALLGERHGTDYWAWVEAIGRREPVRPAPGYAAFKGELFARIDPRYRAILASDVPPRLRLEEVVSGGVAVEGIPALDDPQRIPAAEAAYLQPDEAVFGVAQGGEAAAFPLRFLDWHEMANVLVGGVPVTLSYCTLCRSGVLYAARAPDGSRRFFGTSGLLYRSNKLMLDRATGSLWGNLSGEPVIGPLAASGETLAMLPLTRSTWADWRRRHPRTTVMALDPTLRWRSEIDYRPGRADLARRGVAFPVWLRSDALPDQEEIYGLRDGAAAKAYPLAALLAERVVDDRVGELAVVLVADPGSGAVRAYLRGERRLAAGPDSGVVDEAGRVYRVEEEALRPADPAAAPLPRLAGHLSFWFGWYAFFPHTGVYRPGTDLP